VSADDPPAPAGGHGERAEVLQELESVEAGLASLAAVLADGAINIG